MVVSTHLKYAQLGSKNHFFQSGSLKIPRFCSYFAKVFPTSYHQILLVTKRPCIYPVLLRFQGKIQTSSLATWHCSPKGLLMEKIRNNHLGCLKPCKKREIYHISWCRISSINSIIVYQCITTFFSQTFKSISVSSMSELSGRVHRIAWWWHGHVSVCRSWNAEHQDGKTPSTIGDYNGTHKYPYIGLI